jgi:hypothetical protein
MLRCGVLVAEQQEATVEQADMLKVSYIFIVTVVIS